MQPVPFKLNDIDNQIRYLCTAYPTINNRATNRPPPISLLKYSLSELREVGKELRGFTRHLTLGTYNLANESIELNWYDLKEHCNYFDTNVHRMLVHVITHEVIHNILHRDIGLKATIQFDNIAGNIPKTNDANFNGID